MFVARKENNFLYKEVKRSVNKYDLPKTKLVQKYKFKKMDNPILVFLAVIGALTLGKIIYDVLLRARIKRIERKEKEGTKNGIL